VRCWENDETDGNSEWTSNHPSAVHVHAACRVAGRFGSNSCTVCARARAHVCLALPIATRRYLENNMPIVCSLAHTNIVQHSPMSLTVPGYANVRIFATGDHDHTLFASQIETHHPSASSLTLQVKLWVLWA
jgi:hypothetical protein